MGYDIHITRASEWSDIGPGEAIADQEWLDHVASDPALTLSAENGEYFAVWSGPSRDEESPTAVIPSERQRVEESPSSR